MNRHPETKRLDVVLVERGLAETRARAQALIVGGGVSVDGSPVTKPSTAVAPDQDVRLVTEPLPYVSRGGLKLRHALDAFHIEVEGAVALDVGASTGGFTDVLLQAGAARVYAVDAGYGQLAWTLRNDPRVVVMERTNIRSLTSLPEAIGLAVIDVSFISLRQVLPHVKPLLTPDADAVALVKPQFEAGREQANRSKGVIRDPGIWREVLRRVLTFATETGWVVRGLHRSPIRGPAGNVEFLAHLSVADAADAVDPEAAIEKVLKDE